MSFTFAALDIGITDIEKKSMLEEVDANGSIEDIRDRIKSAIKNV